MSFLINYDSDNANAQFRAYSGRVNFFDATTQVFLSILVPADGPALKVTIPWHTSAAFIPGLPKLYIDPAGVLGDETGGHVVGPESGLIEVPPFSIDETTVPGNRICVYKLSRTTVAPYAGLGTTPTFGGMMLRTNVVKNPAGDINTFPDYRPGDWIEFPPAENTGLLGVTVGNDTGPITVEIPEVPTKISGRPRSRNVIFRGGHRA